jgi:hypothetical protein
MTSAFAFPAFAQQEPSMPTEQPQMEQQQMDQAPSSAANTAEDGERCIKSEVVQFRTGSSKLDAEARKTLDGVASELRNAEDRVARVDGYADPSGDPAMNLVLSEKRAKVVESYLDEQGIAPDRVQTNGRGPIEGEPPPAASSKRVVVVSSCEPEVTPVAQAEPAPPEPPPPVVQPPDTSAPAAELTRAPEQPAGPLSGIGVGVTAGAGVIGFVHKQSRDIADTGGSWEARVTVGTRLPVGLDLAYVGSAQTLNFAGLDSDAYALGNGGEAALRLQYPKGMFRPFLFGGIGWTHYSVERSSVLGTPLLKSDDVGQIPSGLGIAIGNPNGVMFELRGTYRFAFDSDLFRGVEATTGKNAGLSSWNVTARLGAEF